ncbi:MAG: hypothetical protein AAFR93_03265 [Pseudomonadota bacterium]
MELMADGLLMVAAGVAALYCWILSRRLQALKDTKQGLGGAIAGLSHQVEEIQRTLDQSKAHATAEAERLARLVEQAQAVATQVDAGLTRAAKVARVRRAAHARAQSEPPAQDVETAQSIGAAERMGALKALVDGLRA